MSLAAHGGCWEASGGSYLIVERFEIKKWPYGSACPNYHGKPSGPQEKICRLTIPCTRKLRSVSAAART
jgi:hypothetical protein